MKQNEIIWKEISLLNKHGLKGEYKYVCCKQYVKLTNSSMLDIALKKEYGF